MNPIYEISNLAKNIPSKHCRSFTNSITDLLSKGGEHYESYVFQQLRCAKKFVED
ncbi:DUF6877 family protein [Sporosarcina sp. NPDC096371]|uniref:DUF6877 family protein n=1 Tax=Sporosarcina sp. NPDC096371 TaxID=3364530 RepID=UPI0037F2D09C